jgi:hydroxymethylpyrimidine pyrophosphatase-like HAD family hydrolase
MDPTFKQWFKHWAYKGKKQIYFCTGSDYAKTQEQVGADVLYSTDAVFCCAGNAIYSKGALKYSSNWTLKEPAIQWLNDQLHNSLFPHKYGRHVENRIGLVNFSVVGRAADKEQRKKYIEYDRRIGERKKIAAAFNDKFGSFAVAQVAGETGIDIMEPGKDKGQVAKYFAEPNVNLHFFGDQMRSGGNDYPLAQALKTNYVLNEKGKVQLVEVKSYIDTWNYLKKMESNYESRKQF